MKGKKVQGQKYYIFNSLVQKKKKTFWASKRKLKIMQILGTKTKFKPWFHKLSNKL